MPSKWLRPRNVFKQNYDFTQLIDTRNFPFGVNERSRFQIICDIDKTYLETNFESVIQLVKTAFEEAAEKITVRGASEVLTLARWGATNENLANEEFPRPLHFVSASPPQMRSVLEEKLFLDGLDWDTDTFKNQAYNLRRGRMDLLRDHTTYKSSAILRVMAEAPEGCQFFLIGDNAEFDAYVYTGIDLFLRKKLSVDGYCQYLKTAGVDQSIATDFARTLTKEPQCQVRAILIRKVPGYNFLELPPLSDPIFRFDHFFEAALVMMLLGLIDGSHLLRLSRAFHNNYGMGRGDLLCYMKFLRSKDHLPTALQEAIENSAKLLTAVGTYKESSKNLDHLNTKNLIDYSNLIESEILQLAQKWAAKIGGAKS